VTPAFAWWPRSLFGRLVLVLTGGLVIAQALSAWINYAERDRLLFRASATRVAQRIADVVAVLDSLPATDRGRIAAILNGPPLVLRLDRPPLDVSAAPVADDIREAFVAALVAAFGTDRPTRVAQVEGRAMRPPWRGHDDAPPRGRPPGDAPERGSGPPGGDGEARPAGFRLVHFIAQVQLADGTWATFRSATPRPLPPVPWRLAASLALLLAAVLALSWFAVRWITRPLAVLANAAEALGRDIHHPPLAESGPAEVQRAAQAFNTMQARLAGLLADRARIFAAMSHDLKTPLTRMRLRAELLDDAGAREKFERDLAEMEQMVGQTLDYLRGIERHVDRRPVDVGALLEGLQDDFADMKRDVRIDGRALGPYTGDPQLLRRAFANLLDNATTYGHRATIALDDDAARLRITIADDGPGIPENELEQVFAPFHRLEASRNRATGGTGLGLPITRAIIEAHGGTVRLANRDGGGLAAIVELPRIAPASASRAS